MTRTLTTAAPLLLALAAAALVAPTASSAASRRLRPGQDHRRRQEGDALLRPREGVRDRRHEDVRVLRRRSARSTRTYFTLNIGTIVIHKTAEQQARPDPLLRRHRHPGLARRAPTARCSAGRPAARATRCSRPRSRSRTASRAARSRARRWTGRRSRAPSPADDERGGDADAPRPQPVRDGVHPRRIDGGTAALTPAMPAAFCAMPNSTSRPPANVPSWAASIARITAWSACSAADARIDGPR